MPTLRNVIVFYNRFPILLDFLLLYNHNPSDDKLTTIKRLENLKNKIGNTK